MVTATDGFHRFFEMVGAGVFVFAAAYALWSYPIARTELAVGAILYSAVITWRPVLILLLLPLVLTLLNLAPWSGSLFLEEYEIFLAASIAVLLWRSFYQLRIPLSRTHLALLLLLILSYVTSVARVLVELPPSDIDAISTFAYDNSLNGLRVAKGFFLPLLLLPGLAEVWRRDRAQAGRYFLFGWTWAALAVGLVAIWERGVFPALSGSGGLRDALDALLDFSTPYRITGPFAEMHVGGEYIDAFVALTWPFAIAVALQARHPLGRAAGAAAYAAILYAMATTFTRATYLAVGTGMIALVLWSLMSWLSEGYSRIWSKALRAVTVTIAMLIALYIVYRRGGTDSFYLGLLCCSSTLLIGYSARKTRSFTLYGAAMVLMLGAASLARALTGVENSPQPLSVDSLALAACLALCGVYLGTRIKHFVPRTSRAVTLVVLAASSLAVAVPALFGYRMEARLAESVTRSVPERLSHWTKVVELANAGDTAILLGAGIGQFPLKYLASQDYAKSGQYTIGTEGENKYLTLVEGEHMRLTQRINLPAHKDQILALRLRSSSDSFMLRLRLCRRHIIPEREQDPTCFVYLSELKDTGGRWERLEWPFNTGSLGDDGSFGRLPLTFEITNLNNCARRFTPTSVVDVDDITLRDAAGHDVVRNGAFSAGSAGWFPVSDWGHLRWHVKNTWVNMYFDQGILGVVAFGGFILVLLVDYFRRAWSSRTWATDPVGIAGALSLISFVALSPLGSPLDAPRLGVIVYLVFFCLAVDHGIRAQSPPNLSSHARA